MRLQLVIIHFLWLQLVPSVPRSSSSSCIVALIAPHTTSCFIVNTAAAPYCTYDQKVMRRLSRLLTAAGFIHTKKKKKKASTAVKQLTWEQKKNKNKKRGKCLLRTGRFARLFCFLHLRCIKDRDTRAIRGSMRNALKRTPLQHHGRPRCTVTGCGWALVSDGAEIRQLAWTRIQI